MLRPTVSALIFALMSCASLNSPDATAIRSDKNYISLNSEDKALVEKIMTQATEKKEKKYYFEKLKQLLDTPTAEYKTVKTRQRAEVKRAIEEHKTERQRIIEEEKQDLEEYTNQEEFYESINKDRHWQGYRPVWNGPYFYVADDDPLDILVHIQVRLHGDPEDIARVLTMEDAIEKHLYVEGFSVNLVFVGYSSDSKDVFDVNVDQGQWPTSLNWSGEYKGLAHELMHLMGLDDEYDKIEAHATNSFLPVHRRLTLFLEQMKEKMLPDAKDGIMCYQSNKPLERQVCAAAGLGEECVKARMKAFHGE